MKFINPQKNYVAFCCGSRADFHGLQIRSDVRKSVKLMGDRSKVQREVYEVHSNAVFSLQQKVVNRVCSNARNFEIYRTPLSPSQLYCF